MTGQSDGICFLALFQMRKGKDVREFFREVHINKLMDWLGIEDASSDTSGGPESKEIK